MAIWVWQMKAAKLSLDTAAKKCAAVATCDTPAEFAAFGGAIDAACCESKDSQCDKSECDRPPWLFGHLKTYFPWGPSKVFSIKNHYVNLLAWAR